MRRPVERVQVIPRLLTASYLCLPLCLSAARWHVRLLDVTVACLGQQHSDPICISLLQQVSLWPRGQAWKSESLLSCPEAMDNTTSRAFPLRRLWAI